MARMQQTDSRPGLIFEAVFPRVTSLCRVPLISGFIIDHLSELQIPIPPQRHRRTEGVEEWN